MNNKYEIRGDVTAIFLNRKGGVIETLISTQHLERANEFSGSWYAKWTPSTRSFYVQGDIEKNTKKSRYMLHRWIMEAPKHLHVDHINHDTLDNRSQNLRLVTVMENHQNQLELKSSNTSGVRNVYWDKERSLWSAEVKVFKKKVYLGRYESKEEAASVVEQARAVLMPYSQEALQGMNIGELLKPHLNKARRDKRIGSYRNVYWSNSQQKWQVRMVINGEERSFGSYQDQEEANKVAMEARLNYKKGMKVAN